MEKVPSLVSTDWLSAQIQSNTKNLCILDASWHVPAAKRDPLHEYKQQHIPGAKFFNILCAKPAPGVETYSHMVPTAEVFSEYVGNLGIDNNTHVVVYENNAKFGFFSAPRAWWFFRVLGHSKISILDGGLPLWIKEERQMTNEISKVERAVFKASYKPDFLKSFADVQINLESREFQLMDARPAGYFTGAMPDPRDGIESGHTPNATSIPFTMMLREENGVMVFKSPTQLKQTFQEKGIDLAKPLTATCGTGVNACIVAFGAFLAGKEDVSVFNGAWEEYYLKMKDINMANILRD